MVLVMVLALVQSGKTREIKLQLRNLAFKYARQVREAVGVHGDPR